jgi:hypothetical protein
MPLSSNLLAQICHRKVSSVWQLACLRSFKSYSLVILEFCWHANVAHGVRESDTATWLVVWKHTADDAAQHAIRISVDIWTLARNSHKEATAPFLDKKSFASTDDCLLCVDDTHFLAMKRCTCSLRRKTTYEEIGCVYNKQFVM